jgi:hypothetical protein
MSFTWHPKPPSAPLLVPAAGDPAGNRKGGDCDTLLGPSEDPSIYNEIMFLRVQMFDGAITSDIVSTRPVGTGDYGATFVNTRPPPSVTTATSPPRERHPTASSSAGRRNWKPTPRSGLTVGSRLWESTTAHEVLLW